jgi:hypothetical protein
METPALSKIKQPKDGSPSVFGCFASPGSNGRKRAESSDETPTKAPNRSTGSAASKEKEIHKQETFCTFEEPGSLGIRFEVRLRACNAMRAIRFRKQRRVTATF